MNTYQPNWHALLITAMLALFSGPAQAAIPDHLDYQGYITNSSGSPINGTVSITFSLYNVESGGIALWSDTLSVTVTNGLFSVKLGEPGNPFPLGLFDTPLHIGIDVAGDGEMAPRIAMGSAGFSHKADDAETVGGRSAASLDQSGHVSDSGNPHGVTAAQAGAASTADLLGHISSPAVHHSRYSDGEAVSAMGSIADNNPLNHNRYSDAAAVAAMGAKQDSNALHHDKYTDASAIAAAISLLAGQACPPGQYLRGFAGDGSILCNESISVTSISTVDATGDVGTHNSIAIGVDGLPVISYIETSPTTALKVAHCGNRECSLIDSITTVHLVSGTFARTSIAVQPNGLPVISYILDGYLHIAVCGNKYCTYNNTVFPLRTLVGAGIPADDTMPTSMEFGLGDELMVLFNAGTPRVANCSDSDCSSSLGRAQVTEINDSGIGQSLAVNSKGLPYFTYLSTTGTYNIAYCEPAFPLCIPSLEYFPIGTTVNPGRSTNLSLAIGADGLPVASFNSLTGSPGNSILQVMHCESISCDVSSTVTVESGDTGLYSDIAIGVDGMPVISYIDASTVPPEKIKLVHCGNVSCDANNTITQLVGDPFLKSTYEFIPSIAVGSDGRPIISYGIDTELDLKVVHCGSISCAP